MTKKALRYSLPDEFGVLELSPAVLNHFHSHRQMRWLAKEAGGQLFARFDIPSLMNIVDITGPRLTDRRSVFSYRPDRGAEKIEIKDRFARGLHFVGDWHTHKQREPEPSGTDIYNICELVKRSEHNLAGFVLIIVGQASFPEGLHVSFHTKSCSTYLGLADDD